MVQSDILVQLYRLTEWRDDPVQLYHFVTGETGPEERRDLIQVPREARARTGTERAVMVTQLAHLLAPVLSG